MRLIGSDVALAAVLAISAAGELTLGEVARAAGVATSTAQRALEILVEDGVVERTGERGKTYRLRSAELAGHVAGIATCSIPPERAVSIVGRAAPPIELVARRGRTLTVVYSATSTPLEQARPARVIEAVATRHGLVVEHLDHDDARREVLARPELRQEMTGAEILHGEVDRSFPDRSAHGVGGGRPLGRPHASLRLPSRRTLASIARRHGVASMRLFGSAVRTDFRPDSDVDILVDYREGIRPELGSSIELERALELAFGRDVDVVRPQYMDPEARKQAQEEAVALS